MNKSDIEDLSGFTTLLVVKNNKITGYTIIS